MASKLRMLGSIITSVLLLITACAAPTAPTVTEQITSAASAPAASPAAASELVLYLQQEYGPQLQPIDPLTLTDAADRSPFVLQDVSQFQQSQMFITPDGGTIVALVDEQVPVLDGRSGALRAEWPRPQGIIRGIWPDGTRLTGFGLTEDIHAWAVLSATDGSVLTSAQSQYPVFDWQGKRVYSFAGSGDPLEQIEPQPVVVLVHDLASGNEIGRLTLDGVLSGNSTTTGSFGPSMALSPDGKQLVLMHGDADKLTMVDAQQMQVVSTRDLTGSTDPLEVGGSIRGWDLQFAPDGTLYAAGSE